MQADRVLQARRTERQVQQFIEQRSLVGHGERLLLAVSGGPDSLALLHIISQIRHRLRLQPLAAYIDHGLRPAGDIAAERAFVAAQAAGLDVAFVAGTAAGRTSGRRISPEDAARRGRYAALAEIARDVSATAVATGHTRSDQAETVLIRLLGGSGMRGLAAMDPHAGWPVPSDHRPRLVRPLLCLSREDVLEYCASRGLTPRADPENENPRYLRNRVRATVLPALRSLNPNIESVLADLADEVRAWRAEVETSTPCLEQRRGADEQAVTALDVAQVRSLPPSTRLAVLRRSLEGILPDGARLRRSHLLALERLALGPRGGSVMLPGGAGAWREGNSLLIARALSPAVSAIVRDQPVPVPGGVELPGWRIQAELVLESSTSPGGPWQQPVLPAAVEGLVVGPRRPGDRIALAGMAGRRRLQDLFVDCGVPRRLRAQWPVFRADRGVVWVPGVSRAAGWASAPAGPGVLLRAQPVGQGGPLPNG